MNILSVILKNPKLYEIAEDQFRPEEQEWLKIIANIYTKTKQIPSKSNLLNLIKNESVKKKFEEAYDCSDADVLLFMKELKEIKDLQFRQQIADIALTGESLDIDSIRSLKKKCTIDDPVETEFQINNVNNMFEIWKKIDEDSKFSYIPTGYNKLDSLIEKGMKHGSLICLLGGSGSGKTVWLCNIASNVWHKQMKRVLYVTTEMNEKEIFSKILRISLNCSKEEVVNELNKIVTSNQYVWPEIKVIKVHPHDSSCNDIQNMIDDLNWKPELILIDYLDEIKATEKTASEYEKHGVVAADMKKLAEVNDCPVLTATQAARSALDEKGYGSKEIVSAVNISDSYKKVRVLDQLIAIINPIALKSVNQYELYLDKNRYGSSNTNAGYFSVDWSSNKITELVGKPSNPSNRIDNAINNFEQQKFEDAKKAQAEKEEDPTIQKYILAWNKENITQYVKQLQKNGDQKALKAHLLLIESKI